MLAHKHMYVVDVRNTAPTPKGIRGGLFQSQIQVTVAGEHNGFPQFRVLTWQQFCEVLIVSEQRKSQVNRFVGETVSERVRVKQGTIQCRP